MSWVCCLLLLGKTLPAETPVELRWQFRMGQTFYVEETLRVQQCLRLPDTQEKQELDQTRLSRFQVRAVNGAGQVVLEQKILAVRLRSWGSGKPADTDWLRPFEGALFRLTLDRKQRVLQLEGVEALRAALERQKPETAELATVLLRRENLQHPLELLFGFAPDTPVLPGARWQQHYSPVPLANLATLKFTDTYTYTVCKGKDMETSEGTTAPLVSLAVVTTVTAGPPPAIGRLPFRSISQQVRLSGSRGQLLFDSRRGRLQERQREWTLQGVFVLQAGSQQITVELEQQHHYHLRVLDQPPGAK